MGVSTSRIEQSHYLRQRAGKLLRLTRQDTAALPIGDAHDGRILSTPSLVHDGAHGRPAEGALRDSEERLPALTESVAVTITIARNTKPVYANPKFAEMYQRSHSARGRLLEQPAGVGSRP